MNILIDIVIEFAKIVLLQDMKTNAIGRPTTWFLKIELINDFQYRISRTFRIFHFNFFFKFGMAEPT